MTLEERTNEMPDKFGQDGEGAGHDRKSGMTLDELPATLATIYPDGLRSNRLKNYISP